MIAKTILKWAQSRQPDFIIGGVDAPYLRRHWLLPRNRFFNVYVHEFLRSDDDRALHDHPWLFNASILIQGQYIEHTIAAGGVEVASPRKAGDWKFRWGPAPHRVQLIGNPFAEVYEPLSCWTVFITGPIVRKWGFHCPKAGWIPWQKFTNERDKGSVGAGCDQ